MIARLILFILIIFPAFADANYFEDNYTFGVSLIKQYVDIESTDVNETSSTGSSGIGFYFDSYYQQSYRINSALSYVGYKQFDIAEITGAADYLIPVTTGFSLLIIRYNVETDI